MTTTRRAAAICLLALVAPACGSDPVTSADDPSATTGATDQRVVSFSTADLDLEASVADSPIAFVGTVARVSVEPFGQEVEGTMAAGRRIAWVKVSEVRKGNIEEGSEVAVWYGTELAEGVASEGDANITLAPERGQEVYVLASEVSRESKEVAALGYPLYVASEGSGIGIVDDEVVSTRTDSLSIDRVDELVAEK